MKKTLLCGLLLITSCSSFQYVTKSERAPSSTDGGERTRGDGNMGNGGGACVCRSPQDKTKITYAELIDFVFVRERPENKLEVKRNNNVSHDDIFHKIISKDEYFGSKISEQSKEIIAEEEIKWGPGYSGSLSLSDTQDSEIVVDCASALKNNSCHYEQVANYTNEGTLIYKKEIYEAFTETDKAGLELHERIYALDRKINNAKTSDKTRNIVGSFFAGDLNPLKDFFRFTEVSDSQMDQVSRLIKKMLENDKCSFIVSRREGKNFAAISHCTGENAKNLFYLNHYDTKSESSKPLPGGIRCIYIDKGSYIGTYMCMLNNIILKNSEELVYYPKGMK